MFSRSGLPTLHLWALAAALAAWPAHGENINERIDFSAIKVEVTWVESNGEIEQARQRYGAAIEQQGHRRVAQKPEGFAALVARGGELVCRLWVLKPKNVDDERTTALGHELLHCLVGDYHR